MHALHMHTYWIILILTLISTLNIPICKFKYQSMSDHYANHLFDHKADYHLLIIMQIAVCMINCADYNLSDHHANIIQVFTCISIHTKLIFLFYNE